MKTTFLRNCIFIVGISIFHIGCKNTDGLIFIEAESTKSEQGEWIRIHENDSNYVKDASGKTHIEFLGNNPGAGEPNSPLDYIITVPEDGNYRLLMNCSKRLEGARGDMCNDAWVKMSGDFNPSPSTALSKENLSTYLKFFQEGSNKTPENSWNWAYKAEMGQHIFFNLAYQLKKGEIYTLTIAGRAQRFNIDYIVLYNEDKMTETEACDKSLELKSPS